MAEQATTEEHEGHSPQHYIRIWFLLVILLMVSVIGPFVGDATGIQAVTLVTAFGIAVVKAYMVVKNFMHLTMERKFVTYFVVTALVFMLLFFAGAAPDVMKAEGQGWIKPLWLEQAQQAADGHGAEAAHH